MYLKKLAKLGLSLALVISGLFTFTSNVSAVDNNMAYPNVQSYQKEDSKTLTIANESRLYVIANDKSLNNEVLLNDLKLISSSLLAKNVLTKAPVIVFGDEQGISANDIVVKMQDVSALAGKEQSYQLEINDHITVSAKDEVGIYYGLLTVIQMLQANDKTLTQGVILDYPDVNERSFHLDCGRKYFSKEWIIDLIKDLSWQKYTSIQIHFSENEGFRLQSDTLEKIDGFAYQDNQYLTKDDMLEIIQVAKEHHIEVIPSLDSPGHLGAVLRYLPDSYSCSSLFPSDDRRAQCFNIFTNPEARAFLIELMSEYIDFFSAAGCKHFNIGGDEFLADFNRFSNEQYVQIMEYFNEVSKIVKDHGMTPRAWNDGLLYGDYTGYKLDSDIEICYWAGPANCASIAEFVANGNKVINFSDTYMYYVLSWWWQTNACPEGDRIYNEWTPGKFPSLAGTAQTFSEPYPDYVLGSSYAIWCDVPNYMTAQQVANNIFYRTRATAYKSWNSVENLPAYNQTKAIFDKVGRAPGYMNTLPEPGEVYYEGQSASVTLKYVDTNNNVIAENEVHYGLKDNQYAFSAKELYGYRFVEADKPLTGTYDQNIVITLKYELHCDKTALATEINNPLTTNEYINETIKDYQEAYQEGKTIYTNEASTQLEVDNILKTLTDAKAKVVALKDYRLYVETTYPLASQDYISGYDQYKNAVDTGKALLMNPEATAEQLNNAYQAIIAAKADLMKADGNVPSVKASDRYYSNYTYANMLDNNLDTKCWFEQAQVANKTIDFTFAKPVKMSKVRVVQPANVGDDAIKKARVQISTDNTTWQTVGTIADKELDKTFTFDQTDVKHVRIILDEDKGNWYQIAEVYFTFEQIPEDNALRDLIKEAEELDITGKTNASVATMVDALIAAQKAYVANETDTTALQQALREAIDGLKDETTVVVDKFILEKAITAADAVEQSHLDKLIPVVKAEFEAALANAKVVNEKANATQEEVNLATTRLIKAIHKLEFVKANKTALQTLISEVEALKQEDYTEASWKAFTEKLDSAKDVINDANALQYEADNALNALQEAKDALVEIEKPVEVDKSKLQAFYNQVKDTKADKYLPNTWTGFEKALDDASAILAKAEATQEEVDNAYNVLVKAYLDLRLVPNKDALKDLITKAENLNNPKLAQAIAQAKAVVADENATEAQVKGAYATLEAAIKGLDAGDKVVAKGDKAVATGDNNAMASMMALAGLSLAGLWISRKKFHK